MEKNGWDCGQDDEELFELAMHERQYRDYKSGVAKQRFEQELEQARQKAGTPKIVTRAVVEVPSFDVETLRKEYPSAIAVQAPCSGQILWQIDYVDRSTPPVPGTAFKAGEPICWVQNYYGIEAVPAPADGKILEVEFSQGKMVEKNQVLAFLEK
jgi:pyruvate carboxylase subunit B